MYVLWFLICKLQKLIFRSWFLNKMYYFMVLHMDTMIVLLIYKKKEFLVRNWEIKSSVRKWSIFSFNIIKLFSGAKKMIQSLRMLADLSADPSTDLNTQVRCLITLCNSAPRDPVTSDFHRIYFILWNIVYLFHITTEINKKKKCKSP